jgi:hypothetical protein
MDEKQREVLRQRQAQISAVMSHPGWGDHVAEANRKIARLEKRAAALALSPNGADQRMLDYMRGWIDALRWSYRMPEHAEESLRKFMDQLEAGDD